MFSTLQAAFGTWPTDSSHIPGRAGGLNEGFNFGSDDLPIETGPVSAASVFRITPERAGNDVVFVPPCFKANGDLDAIERFANRPTVSERRKQPWRSGASGTLDGNKTQESEISSHETHRSQDSVPTNSVKAGLLNPASHRPFSDPCFTPPDHGEPDLRTATIDSMDIDVPTRDLPRGYNPPTINPSAPEFGLRGNHLATSGSNEADEVEMADSELAESQKTSAPLGAASATATSATKDNSCTFASRSPSPNSLGEDFERQRQSLWGDDARMRFHEMVAAPGYTNRYRMHMKKKQRMIAQLEQPDVEIMLCDGSKDHQTKYQSLNWSLKDGRLYRKPDAGRVGKLRRHLDEVEAWDVLSREHLLSGHLGRDKLRKRLEQKYIGYTIDEIMLVLKECKRCGGRGKSSASISDNSIENVPASLAPQESLPGAQTARRMVLSSPIGPFNQTSNAMLF